MSKRLPFEIRKVQRPQHNTLVSIPKRFADLMRLGDGSLVKIEFERNDSISIGPGKRLVITKIFVPSIDDDDNGSSQELGT